MCSAEAELTTANTTHQRYLSTSYPPIAASCAQIGCNSPGYGVDSRHVPLHLAPGAVLQPSVLSSSRNMIENYTIRRTGWFRLGLVISSRDAARSVPSLSGPSLRCPIPDPEQPNTKVPCLSENNSEFVKNVDSVLQCKPLICPIMISE